MKNMLGANEALRRLKEELDLVDARVVPSHSKGYVAMSGRNPYLSFRLALYLKREECFKLDATSHEFNYSMLEEMINSEKACIKERTGKEVLRDYTFILNDVMKVLAPYQDKYLCGRVEGHG
jgi:hypothetical protein